MLTIYLSGAISNKDINVAKKEFSKAERKIKKDLKTLKIDKNYYEIINPFRVLKINKKYFICFVIFLTIPLGIILS